MALILLLDLITTIQPIYDNEGINQEELSNMLFWDKVATARAVKLPMPISMLQMQQN